VNRLASRHRGRRPVGDRLIDQGGLASGECSVELDIVLTS
jgi:hypothetical protein